MTSIYKKVLQNDYTRLHPMLQKRYDVHEQTQFKASGTMSHIQGGPKWLYPFFLAGARWKLLFPEKGRNIPFTITNTAFRTAEGNQQIHWERCFYFPNKKRYFNALMNLDETRMIVEDYLGEPSLLYSDLQFTVTEGGALEINSLDQRLVAGKLEIPLPRCFQGLATIVESYDDQSEVFRIRVDVKNILIGSVFSYEGEFTADA